MKHTNFRVYKNFELSGEAGFCLTKLYLPLIGIDSFALYNLLMTYDNKETYDIRTVLDSLNFNNDHFFQEALNKLNALSLVETYFDEEKGYYLYLKQPLAVESFLSNRLLVKFLTEKIGPVEVENITKNLNYKIRGYTDITKTFDEVYVKDFKEEVDPFAKLFFNKIKDNINIKGEKFDYLLFKMEFDENIIPSAVFDDPELKNKIINVAYTYDLNVQEMKQVIEDVVLQNNDLPLSKIGESAEKIYTLKAQSQNKKVQSRFVTKEPDAFVSSKQDDTLFELVNILENNSPKNILESLSGITASKTELRTLERLTSELGLARGVVNVLLYYVLNEKEGTMPSYNYFEKVANEWARKGVKDTKSALLHTKQLKEQPKGGAVKYTSKKTGVRPDWMDQYEEETEAQAKEKQKQEQEYFDNLSEEEKAKLEEKIKKVLG